MKWIAAQHPTPENARQATHQVVVRITNDDFQNTSMKSSKGLSLGIARDWGGPESHGKLYSSPPTHLRTLHPLRPGARLHLE